MLFGIDSGFYTKDSTLASCPCVSESFALYESMFLKISMDLK